MACIAVVDVNTSASAARSLVIDCARRNFGFLVESEWVLGCTLALKGMSDAEDCDLDHVGVECRVSATLAGALSSFPRLQSFAFMGVACDKPGVERPARPYGSKTSADAFDFLPMCFALSLAWALFPPCPTPHSSSTAPLGSPAAGMGDAVW